jgi:chromosome segregation ATPase
VKSIKEFKKIGKLSSKYATLLGVVVLGGPLLVSSVASADIVNGLVTPTLNTINNTVNTAVNGLNDTVNTAAETTKTTTAAQKQSQDIQNIITKGDQEISRRLTTLGTLTGKINDSIKLTDSDRSILSNEVSTTTSGLSDLETTLNGDTTITTAHSDALSIYTEYRVYALVAPKVNLVKVADDQQAVEAKLTTLAQKLQTRITAEQQAGKDVTTLQSELNDMTSKISAAQAISSNVESSIINLQPSDYNANHDVLEGYNTQLKTAHEDDAAALADAKEIVSGLKSL